MVGGPGPGAGERPGSCAEMCLSYSTDPVVDMGGRLWRVVCRAALPQFQVIDSTSFPRPTPAVPASGTAVDESPLCVSRFKREAFQALRGLASRMQMAGSFCHSSVAMHQALRTVVAGARGSKRASTEANGGCCPCLTSMACSIQKRPSG